MDQLSPTQQRELLLLLQEDHPTVWHQLLEKYRAKQEVALTVTLGRESFSFALSLRYYQLLQDYYQSTNLIKLLPCCLQVQKCSLLCATHQPFILLQRSQVGMAQEQFMEENDEVFAAKIKERLEKFLEWWSRRCPV